MRVEYEVELWRRVAAAISGYERRDGPLGRDDLEGLDAFHAGGRAATRALARLVGLESDSRVLDIGCGLGGPARSLVLEHGAGVTGVDSSLEMIQAGIFLNRYLDLAGRPTLVCADGASLPLAARSFDVVWLQHLMASVADKAGLIADLERVLAPQGVFALHEIVAQTGEHLDFPLPWAGSPQESFLSEVDELTSIFASFGFAPLKWVDWTAPTLDWFEAPRPEAWRDLNLKLVLGDSAGQRARNLAQGLKSGRARVIQAVFGRKQENR
jgi:SAM-dependent methyltransferase